MHERKVCRRSVLINKFPSKIIKIECVEKNQLLKFKKPIILNIKKHFFLSSINLSFDNNLDEKYNK